MPAPRAFALAALLLLTTTACRRPTSDERSPTTTTPSTTPTPTTTPSTTTTSSSAPKLRASSIDLVIAGDAIPQQRVLALPVADILAGVPACWLAADARILNLEAPIGGREGLPTDKTMLTFAAPPSWFADLYAASHASAFVVANNHSCDLGPAGLANTVAEAAKLSAPIIGADAVDPWKRVDVVEKDGRHVCVVAWTAFLNDKGKKQKGCLEGEAGAKVARAELMQSGTEIVHRELGRAGRWDGCDARVAILHGGREYMAQVRLVTEQATAAATYVDAVIVSHPHVPDLVEIVRAPVAPTSAQASLGGRVAGRAVPLYKSLGNFISNQGIAWTRGMTLGLPEIDGQPDSLRMVWTRLAMIARLRFSWDEGAPPSSAPTHVFYGYSLAFTEREPIATIRLRAIAADHDPIGERLATGVKPFSDLFHDRCLLSETAPPTCEAAGATTGP